MGAAADVETAAIAGGDKRLLAVGSWLLALGLKPDAAIRRSRSVQLAEGYAQSLKSERRFRCKLELRARSSAG